jgi:hypothetical protein
VRYDVYNTLWIIKPFAFANGSSLFLTSSNLVEVAFSQVLVSLVSEYSKSPQPKSVFRRDDDVIGSILNPHSKGPNFPTRYAGFALFVRVSEGNELRNVADTTRNVSVTDIWC